MVAKEDIRQIFLSAFVRRIMSETTPFEVHPAIQPHKPHLDINPISKEKHFSHALSLQKTVSIPATFSLPKKVMQPIKQEKQQNTNEEYLLSKFAKDEESPYIKGNVDLLNIPLELLEKNKDEAEEGEETEQEESEEGEEEYDLTELHFPRPVIVQETPDEDQDQNQMQIGEITLEKVPEETDLPVSVNSESNEPQMVKPTPQLQRQPPQQTHQQIPAQLRRPMQPMQQRPPMPPRPPQMQTVNAANMQKPKPKVKTFPSIVEKISILGFTKIDELLEDPKVQSIECPGPDKPVLVYRSGVIQTTPLMLKSEEIEAIMKEISDKTRIPLTTGVFRAALHKFIITAVLSEFVGTRFIIQKKSQANE